jgi:hypothetical protein
MFETNLRDERYLPFENSGVISEWQLELPANPTLKDPRQFDYNTISDVVLHIRYTARQGGGLLRREAMKNVGAMILQAQAAGSARLFSVRNEFATEWAQFKGQAPVANERFPLTLDIREDHYPYWSQGRRAKVVRFDLVARSAKAAVPATLDVYDRADTTDANSIKDTLTKDTARENLLFGKLTNIALPSSPVSEVKFFFADREIGDLWVAVTWGDPES